MLIQSVLEKFETEEAYKKVLLSNIKKESVAMVSKIVGALKEKLEDKINLQNEQILTDIVAFQPSKENIELFQQIKILTLAALESVAYGAEKCQFIPEGILPFVTADKEGKKLFYYRDFLGIEHSNFQDETIKTVLFGDSEKELDNAIFKNIELPNILIEDKKKVQDLENEIKSSTFYQNDLKNYFLQSDLERTNYLRLWIGKFSYELFLNPETSKEWLKIKEEMYHSMKKDLEWRKNTNHLHSIPETGNLVLYYGNHEFNVNIGHSDESDPRQSSSLSPEKTNEDLNKDKNSNNRNSLHSQNNISEKE